MDRTYIFTMDSLGLPHPEVIRLLEQYLSLEAQDKCNVSEIKKCVGKMAVVGGIPSVMNS